LALPYPDVLSNEIAVKGMHVDLGYPLYFIPFIGVAKVLGEIAILISGNARIKEWAYAGLFFDLIGATYSTITSGGNTGQCGFMIMPITLGVLSYFYYQKRKSNVVTINLNPVLS
jgi:hypothetical protein